MKRTGFKNKPRKPLKWSPLLRKTKLRVVGHSTTAELKQEIQDLVRDIVILRDGGCILRNIRRCNDSVLQADHLITRANSATFADTRLIVCLCRTCHGGFKKWHKEEYDELIKSILPKNRLELWEKCQKDSWRPVRTGAHDWKLAIVGLKAELKKLK